MRFRFAIFCLLTSLWPLASSAGDLSLPDFGDPSAQYLGVNEERQLGAKFMQRLRERDLVIEDIELNEYLNSIGQRIALYTDQGAGGYHFFWMNASSINAFAAPGGYIGVHSGLLLATDSEDELAGVLAHEAAHVSQRHIARAYADAQQLSIPMAAAMVAAAAIAAADGQAGQAALAGVAALGTQRRINFTRANEREADRIGYRLLSRAGFDPNGLTALFARLQRVYGGNTANIPEFLLTHPLPANRIADAQSRIDSAGSASAKQSRRGSRGYLLAKARARVLTTRNKTQALRYFKDRLQENSAQQPARYGYALALTQTGRFAEASKVVRQLRQTNPDELAFHILQAEVALASGDSAAAWQSFENSRKLYPDDFRLGMHYGRALATEGEPRKAMQLLQPYLKRRPNDLALFKAYAQAAQRSGAQAATHAAMAEYYYLRGELRLAVEQAKIGLREPAASGYERAQLQARLKHFEQAKKAAE